MPRPVFTAQDLQRQYEAQGYVSFPLLPPEVVREVAEGYARLTLEDKYGIGYKVSLYSADLETRHTAREFLIDSIFPALEPFLADRYPYMATYLVKEPTGRPIPPHQDWSHCDETIDDSIMCWIPLCDVDEENGGLGFIDGSHRYFDYLRVFPYQVARSPIDEHGARLMSYLSFPAMRAGDAVIFNNRTIHGSLANQTAGRRTALSFALHPKGEPLVAYYLKPGSNASTVLRYPASPEFYLEYQNPRLTELYQRGQIVEGHPFEEVPYRMPTVGWDEFEAILRAGGNTADPKREALVQELLRSRGRHAAAAGTGHRT
jgi:hypothetical protein